MATIARPAQGSFRQAHLDPLPSIGSRTTSSETTQLRAGFPRRTAIFHKCLDCVYDPRASGRPREQVAACNCTGCALWPVRELPPHSPDWLKSRDPARLPQGFSKLDQAAAVRAIRHPHGGI
jgi:hypothetical protein